ncbi:MAG: cyclase family protein [Saprospiraceae bacterium]|nr:cyclase family protein [Saprospiraceae bacterium]
MRIKLEVGEKIFTCDLYKGIDISIPFVNEGGVVAFGADNYKSTPFRAGDFIGNLESGSPVNFYNLFFNPHGNGTHTESVLHIDERGKTISETLTRSHFIAKLITVEPSELNNGDLIIDLNNCPIVKEELENIEALIIRTTPNTTKKLSKNYTNTNPCYFDKAVMETLNETSIKHLLIDLPSVDREEDGGMLLAHNSFWKTKTEIAIDKTITEMIYVDNAYEDGLYLLNIHTISVDIDASPSKPILFELKEI